MSFTAINTPLVALFSLAYGLGHPDVAPFRPALVDKTLSSFHDDLNRTAKEVQTGTQRLIDTHSLLKVASSFTAPPSSERGMVLARQSTVPVAMPGIERGPNGFIPVAVQKIPMGVIERKSGSGFTVLSVR